MDEFKDLVGDMPPTDSRVGYAPTIPPPIVSGQPVPRPRMAARQRDGS
jgi:hypothetical protein